jgi:hypothetical protein
MMQSQGLGALMPQGAPAQQPQAMQMNNPRLAAATNLVSSDAERQILDPRTLAMLKYKDALQAMQAADQMMAASQPAPMPPTVAERTKMAAEQGIAGLASRLSPGLQQQGNRMQTQQLQQAVSGGLPQLPAPNMARMAGGGIVAFQAGGPPVYESAEERRAKIRAESEAAREDRQNRIAAEKAASNKRMDLANQGYSIEQINQIMASETPSVASTNIPALELMEFPPSMNVGAGMQAQISEAPPAPTPQEIDPISAEQAVAATSPSGAQPAQPAQPELTGIASLLGVANTPVEQVGTRADSQVLRDLTNKRLEYNLDPARAEQQRTAEEARYRAATDPSMEELKALIRSRSAALDAPLYSPEEQRSREISALLGGLASSNLIAQGGPAASRGVREVEDAVRADARTRAGSQFDLATGLIEQERAARQGAYTAGAEAARAAETGANQAMQSANAQLTSLGEIDAARSLQQQQMQFDVIKVQFDEAAELRRLGRYDAQTNATLAATLENVLQNAETTKATLLQTLAVAPEENSQPIQDAIDAIDLELGAIRARFNELTGVRAAPIETPTPTTGEFDLTPEAADVFSRYRE